MVFISIILIMNTIYNRIKYNGKRQTKETDTALKYANYIRNNNNVYTIESTWMQYNDSFALQIS